MTGRAPTPAAKRQRRHRIRRLAGKRVLAIEVENEFVDRLVTWGWIRADQVKDSAILGDVVQDIAECKQRGVFHKGPIVVTGTATGS